MFVIQNIPVCMRVFVSACSWEYVRYVTLLGITVTERDPIVPRTAATDSGALSARTVVDTQQPGIEPATTVFGATPAHLYHRLLAIAGDGRLAVFDVYSGRELLWFIHGCGACALVFSGLNIDSMCDHLVFTRPRAALAL